MPVDINKREFDDGTKFKLIILQEYLKEWLPVFLVRKRIIWKKVFVYDFFAGDGTDAVGNYGSPLIILDELRTYCKSIRGENITVKVVFNEFRKRKSKALKEICDTHLKGCKDSDTSGLYCPLEGSDGNCVFKIVVENKDFKEFFADIYQIMKEGSDLPRFMFLDQYGVKNVTADIFKKLISLERTDFLFFISSSFARRFIENPEFKKYLSITRQDFNENKPYHCHRVIFNYYKSLLGPTDNLYLAPFSIKKNKNIYGLIFGSHHSLGIEKFLNIGWKLNTQTGDANYDIDEEKINSIEPKLFKEFDVPSKIQLFESELRTKLQAKEFDTNIEIYKYALESGFLFKHANKVLNEMKEEGTLPKDFKIISSSLHKARLSKIYT